MFAEVFCVLFVFQSVDATDRNYYLKVSSDYNGTRYEFIEYVEKEYLHIKGKPETLGNVGPTIGAEVGDNFKLYIQNGLSFSIRLKSDVQVESIGDSVAPGETGLFKGHVDIANLQDQCNPHYYYAEDGDGNELWSKGLFGCFLVCPNDKLSTKLSTSTVLVFSSIKHDQTNKLIHSINGFQDNSLHFDICAEEVYILGISVIAEIFPLQIRGAYIKTEMGVYSNLMVYPCTGYVVNIIAESDVFNGTILSLATNHLHAKMSATFTTCSKMHQESRKKWKGHLNQELFQEFRFHSEYQKSKNVRTYYIITEPIFWDYGPSGRDLIDGMKLDNKYKISRQYFYPTRKNLGGKFMKVKFTAYTDDTFTQPVYTNPEQETIIGPPVRIEMGEILRVVFLNNATQPYNFDIPELLPYLNGNSKAVLPRERYTYEWDIPDDIPLSFGRGMCETFMYKSTIHEVRDIATGLYGPALICKTNTLGIDNEQSTIDKEMILTYSVINEVHNWFIDESLLYAHGIQNQEAVDLKNDQAFINALQMHSINGYSYANLPTLTMQVDQLTSIHILCIGNSTDSHNIHITNHTFSFDVDGQEELQSIQLIAGSHATVYVRPPQPGNFEIVNLNWEMYQHGLKAAVRVEEDSLLRLQDEYEQDPDDWMPFGQEEEDYEDEEDEDEHSDESTISIGTTREYFIAAVEVEWDYNINNEVDTENTTFKKVAYREFVDSNFTEMKIRKSDEGQLGLLGPLIKCEVGDTIIIHFQNRGCGPFSIHSADFHFFQNDTGRRKVQNYEELRYGAKFPDIVNDGVAWPGNTHVYTWIVPQDYKEISTASELDKCKSSFYYSAVYPIKDMNSGLLGPIQICAKGTLSSDAGPHVTDRNFILLFKEFDESQSWYFDENLDRYPSMQHFQFSTVNGFITVPYADDIFTGDVVAWHIMSLNTKIHFVELGETVYWSSRRSEMEYTGADVVYQGQIVPILPGSTRSVIMNASNSGRWKTFDKYDSNTDYPSMMYNVQEKDCSSVLGMESKLISDDQVTSSSYHTTRVLYGFTTGRWKPEYARLNQRGHNNAWMAERNDRNPWIQVDFGAATRVTAIATQGVRVGWIDKYATKFAVKYSTDSTHWFYLRDNWKGDKLIFNGNVDGQTPHRNEISPRILARYIRIEVVDFKNQPALRLEFYGCPFSTECGDSLGIAVGGASHIPDSAISASSHFIYKRLVHWKPHFGRLNYVAPITNSRLPQAPAWSPQKSNRRQWIQIDLHEVTKIVGVVLQGAVYKRCKLFVKSYLLHYSNDGVAWNVYKDPVSQNRKILRGNIDPVSEVAQRLVPPIAARYIRLQPWSWRGRIAMRVDLLGCTHDHEENVIHLDPLDCKILPFLTQTEEDLSEENEDNVE